MRAAPQVLEPSEKELLPLSEIFGVLLAIVLLNFPLIYNFILKSVFPRINDWEEMKTQLRPDNITKGSSFNVAAITHCYLRGYNIWT